MRQPAAKQGDLIVANDMHTAMFLVGQSEVPARVPHPFNGVIQQKLSGNVNIMGLPAATTDSVASDPSHQLPPPGATRFANPPANHGQVTKGSDSVRINNQPAIRHDDVAATCNDPADLEVGTVVATGTVLIG